MPPCEVLNSNMDNARILKRSDCEIFYQISGRTDKPLIIFTHGSAVDHRLFDPQVEAVGQHYRVLVWDVRGHGRSKPIDKHFSLALAADDLIALVHEAGYQQAVLVGVSMGSYICQEAIFRKPQIAQGFISIGAPCITLPQGLADRFRLKVGTLLSPLYPYESLKNPTSRLASMTEQGQAYMLDAMNLVNASEYAHIMRAVGSGFHAEADYQIGCPLLIAHGDHDYASLQKQAVQWAKRDQATLIQISEAGHIANYDNPAFFNQSMLDFLSKTFA